MHLGRRRVVELEGSDLGGGTSHVTLVLGAIEVEQVHAIAHLANGQAIVDILVLHNQEVAVPVGHISYHEVTLVVVECQADEVFPSRDNHSGDVTLGNKLWMIVVIGRSRDYIVDFIAVLPLGNVVNEGGHAGLAIGVGVTFDHEILPLTILIIIIYSEYLGHVVLRVRHLVQRGYPSQCNLIVLVVRFMALGNSLGHSIQINLVETHLGSIILVILTEPGRKLIDICTINELTDMLTISICSHIGNHVTSINGIAIAIIILGGPMLESVVGNKEVKSRQCDSLRTSPT